MRAKIYLEHLLKKTFQARGLEWTEKVTLELPKDKQFGDMATNAAMVLSKQSGMAPKELAHVLLEDLRDASEIEQIEIAGPGFLNVTFNPGFWQKTVLTVLEQGDQYGASDQGAGKKVLVEYVSANPTGPLHIGHGRGAAVGDSLARILRFFGYDVMTEYYLNDAGRQMSLLAQSIWSRYQELVGLKTQFPEEGYKGKYIYDLAKAVRDDYNDSLLSWPEDEAVALCGQLGTAHILKGIEDDLVMFGAGLDNWFSEKDLINNRDVERILDWLSETGLVYEKEGALWFQSCLFGDDKDRVVRKSDGTLTYFASDIAYHANKFSRGFDLLIDVWGADHHGYIPRIKAAVQGLGHSERDVEVVLIQLVNLLRRGEHVSMSTRAGEFDTLKEVCQEVGVDAARFMFLTRKSDSHLDFDLELLKEQSMDNPVYYVQYAHARICSMLKKAREINTEAIEISEDLLQDLSTEEDLDLLKTIDRFSETVHSAVLTLSPHHISFYLQELAGLLHRYYNKHHVLNSGCEDLTMARLALMRAVKQVIHNGLRLLGVSAPETM
jgi:arginyl-tRNA synthetase